MSGIYFKKVLFFIKVDATNLTLSVSNCSWLERVIKSKARWKS